MKPPILEYQGTAAPVTLGAVTVFACSIVGLVFFFYGFPALLTWGAALVVRRRIAERMDVRGHNLATAAAVISSISVGMFMVMLVMTPSLGGSRLSSRSVCAANLRGIAQSLAIYAADNAGAFPIVNYAPYTRALQNPGGVKQPGTADEVIKGMYAVGFRAAGSVPANLWILVLNGQVAPKQFWCPSDPYATSTPVLAGGGSYLDGFQNGGQISYSAAYPWRADGTVGEWWRNTNDASLPILADMAPLQGTGKPARSFLSAGTPAIGATWNSGNHQGDGQNVAYADGHAEFARRPDVGQNYDNIYSMSATPSRGPARYGGVAPGSAAPNLMVGTPPYDIVMIPVRNLNTGGL